MGFLTCSQDVQAYLTLNATPPDARNSHPDARHTQPTIPHSPAARSLHSQPDVRCPNPLSMSYQSMRRKLKIASSAVPLLHAEFFYRVAITQRGRLGAHHSLTESSALCESCHCLVGARATPPSISPLSQVKGFVHLASFPQI